MTAARRRVANLQSHLCGATRRRLTSLNRDISGKVAVVTGAASGHGAETARLFADEGCKLALCDINGCDELAQQIISAGGEAVCFSVDLSDREATKRLAAEVLAHFGNVDILINNAGCSGFSPVNIAGEDEINAFERNWDKNVAINLTSQIVLTQALLKSLARNGDGRIVNIASTEGTGATIFNSAYVAAKHGSVGLTKALAVELGSQGVTVNCIQPGPITTAMTSSIPGRQKETFAKRLVPLRRYGMAEEVAHITVSLCMPSASYLNGAVIPVDGGLLANNALLPFKLPWERPRP